MVVTNRTFFDKCLMRCYHLSRWGEGQARGSRFAPVNILTFAVADALGQELALPHAVRSGLSSLQKAGLLRSSLPSLLILGRND